MWSKDKIKHIAQSTNLSKQEVYKWHWEQKRQRFTKIINNENDPLKNLNIPMVDEFGGYAKIGLTQNQALKA
jgi:hypothetical protein